MDQTVPDNDVGSAGTSTPPENATPKDDKQPRNDPRIDAKESAINQRLEQAAHLRDEAQRVYGEAKAKATPAPANQQDASKDPQAAADDDAVAKEFLNAIYAGEDEKALSAVNKLFGKGRNAEAPATPDTEAIAQRVKQQIDTERALETFGSTYQEIVDDPYLADIADRFLAAELRVSGTSLNDALTKAGNATRDWVKQKAGSYTPPTPTTTPKRDEKLARKEQIDLVPSINASAASTEPAIQTT